MHQVYYMGRLENIVSFGTMVRLVLPYASLFPHSLLGSLFQVFCPNARRGR